jgi:hypothetical protein
VSGAALFAGQAASWIWDDFIDGIDVQEVDLSGGPGSASNSSLATVPGGWRTIGLDAAGHSSGLKASVAVSGVDFTFNVSNGAGANSSGYTGAAPTYSIRYEDILGGTPIDLVGNLVGMRNVTVNDRGFYFWVTVLDTSLSWWTSPTVWVPGLVAGDVMSADLSGHGVDLTNLKSLNIVIDPLINGDVTFDAVVVPEPTNTALAIGGLCFVGFLGRRFLKK